jgi:hypothetical protein
MGNTQATSQQYTNVLSTSTFYCPTGQTYCTIPKEARVNFPFNINSNLVVSGNVGVGTTTPTSKLDVNGSVNIDGNLTISNSITNPVSWTIIQEPTTNNLCFRQTDSANITRTKFCLSGSGESNLWAYSREEANTPYFYANRDTTSANKKGRLGAFMGGSGFVGWNA